MKQLFSFLLSSALLFSFSIFTNPLEKSQTQEKALPKTSLPIRSKLEVLFDETFDTKISSFTQEQAMMAKIEFIKSINEGMLGQIAVLIRSMGRALSKGQGSLSVKNRTLAIQNLAELQSSFFPIMAAFQNEELTNNQKKESSLDDTLLSIAEKTVYFIDKVSDYLIDQLSYNFSKPKKFDFNSILSKKTVPSLSKKYLLSIDNKIKKLQKNSLKVGLTALNKTLRLVDRWKNSFEKIHSMFPIGNIAILGSILGTYYLWKNSSADSLLTKILGVYPKIKTIDPNKLYNDPTIDKAEPTRLGYLVDLIQTGFTQDAIINITGASLISLTPIFLKNIYQALRPHAVRIWNKARGGLYGELSVEGLFMMQPRHTLDDVVGYNNIKTIMREVVQCLTNPEQFMAASEKRNMRYLFSGVSRAGKTYMVEALCGSVQQFNPKCNLFVIDYQIIQMVGVKNIFAQAKLNAPTIIFFDEAHLLNLKEDGDSKLLQEFLTAMGGQNDFDPSNPVVVIMATTNPESLATPLRNRLQNISFGLPNMDERAQYIEKELQQNLLDPNQFDIAKIAQKAEGLAFSDLSDLFSYGSIKAWIESRLFSQDFLDEVFDQILRKIVPDSYQEITDKNVLNELAVYIAGKAIATTLLETNNPLDICTINKVEVKAKDNQTQDILDPNSQFGALFRKATTQTQGITSSIEAKNNIKILLSGRAAQKIMFGTTHYGIHKQDDIDAYNLIKKWFVSSFSFEAPEMKNNTEKAIHKTYTDLFLETEKLLSENKKTIDLLAHILQRYGTVPGEYIAWIIFMIKEKKTLSEQEENELLNTHPKLIVQQLMQEIMQQEHQNK